LKPAGSQKSRRNRRPDGITIGSTRVAESGVLTVEDLSRRPGDPFRYRRKELCVRKLRGLLGCQELRGRGRADKTASCASILRHNVGTRDCGCRLSTMRPKAWQTMRGREHSNRAQTTSAIADRQVRVCGGVQRVIRCADRMPSPGRERIAAASDNNALQPSTQKHFAL